MSKAYTNKRSCSCANDATDPVSAARGRNKHHAEAAQIAFSRAIWVGVLGRVATRSLIALKPRLMDLRDLQNDLHRFGHPLRRLGLRWFGSVFVPKPLRVA